MSRYFWISGWALGLLAAFAVGRWTEAQKAPEPPPPRAEAPTALPPGERERSPASLSGEAEGPAVRPGLTAGEGRASWLPFPPESPRDWEEARRLGGLLEPDAALRAAGEWLTLPPSRRRDEVLGELLARAALADPEAALGLAARLVSPASRESLRRSILRAWASRQPEVARAWMEETRGTLPSFLRARRYAAWLEGWAERDPTAALDGALAFPVENRSEGWMQRRAVARLVEAEVEAGRVDPLLATLAAWPEGEARRAALEALYGTWVRRDPEAALAHWESRARDGEEGGGELAAGLVREWTEADPAAAAAFVRSLGPADPAYEAAVSSLVERWSRYEVEGPAEWLNGEPPTPKTDRAVAVYSVRAAREDPAAAMSWAESIEDEELRTGARQRVAQAWRERDEQGFERYLEQSGLDEETRATLRNPPGRGWSEFHRFHQ